MIKNYFKSAVRNLLREKTSTTLNLVGLTLGITSCLALYLFISHSNSFDRYHTRLDRIYRVVSQSMGNHGLQFTQAIPRALPGAFKSDFKEVEEVAFTSYRRESMVGALQSGKTKKYDEPKGVAFSEPSFFKIFDRKILIGSAEKGLDEPNEAIISQRWALKYFQKEDAVGEIIIYDQQEYRIAAVMENFPVNTDLPFDLILSYITIRDKNIDSDWGNYADTDNCYVLLKNTEAISSLNQLIPGFVKKYTGNDIDKSSFIMQPLRDLHSDSRFGNYNTKLPKQAQTIFAVIALFMLATSCVNFTNIATAVASKRTREVGIRKILGSGRSQLIFQFLLESFLVIGLAILLSLAGAQLFLSWLNSLMDASIKLEPTLPLFGFLVLLLFLVTGLSGLYPAWLTSSFRPTDALRNLTMSKSSGGLMLRRGLVVIQFFISQFFIIGTLVLTTQMDFMQKMDIGYIKENIISIPIPVTGQPTASNEMNTMKEQISSLSEVSAASLAFAPPSYKAVIGTSVSIVGAKEPFDTQVKPVDAGYAELFGIKLLDGEGLPDTDTATSVLVNEEFLKVAGLSDAKSVIGTEVFMWDKKLPISGVVKNFNTQSLSERIEPVVLVNSINDYRAISVRISERDQQATIKKIQTIWEETYPEYIFQYTYVDDQIKSLYRGETKIMSMLKVFAGVAILIGCLGLHALITFIATRRTKEIGVRKLLGASLQSIVGLFTYEFGKLLILSFVLAAPVAGLFMNLLLQEFAYRIELGPIVFLTALVITFLIAFATVGYNTFRAATANPVDSLKTE